MDRFLLRTTIGVAPLEISNISSKSSDVNTIPDVTIAKQTLLPCSELHRGGTLGSDCDTIATS